MLIPSKIVGTCIRSIRTNWPNFLHTVTAAAAADAVAAAVGVVSFYSPCGVFCLPAISFVKLLLVNC